MKQLRPWGFDGNISNSLVVTASLEEGEGSFSTLSSHVNQSRFTLKLSPEKFPIVVAGGEKILILHVLLLAQILFHYFLIEGLNLFSVPSSTVLKSMVCRF